MANPFHKNRRDFLLRSMPGAALAGLSLSKHGWAATKLADQLSYEGYWQNWSGNVSASPSARISPRSLEELQAAVKNSKRIRAVGSGHSFSPLAATNDTLLETKGLNRVLSFDRERMQMTVEAGTVLSDFNEAAAKLGCALPSLGDVAYQTMAGAISTGTHGTGIQWGSYSDQATTVGARLVLADGSILDLSADRPADEKYLKAARLSLGAIGILHSLTLQLVPIHNLEMVNRTGTLDEALNSENYLKNDHYKFWYFPFTDIAYLSFENKTDKPVEDNPIKKWFQRVFLENILMSAILKAASWDPDSIPNVMKMLSGTLSEERMIDRSDRVMCTTRTMKIVDLEYAVPASRAKDVVKTYQECVASFARRRTYFANIPLLLRFGKGDQGTYLTHAPGDDLYCFVDVNSHVAIPGYEEFFRELESRLIAMGGKPHWGKIFYQNPWDRIEGAPEFEKIRNELDPTRKFMTPYMERLLTTTDELPGHCDARDVCG